MDSLNITPDQTPAAGANDEELAKAGEAAVNAGNTHGNGGDQTSTPATKPEWVPEKFWNPQTGQVDTEGMAKSYQELEKSRGQNKPDSVMKIESVDQAKELATSKGIDFGSLESEYASNGDLTEDTYKSLEAKGISKDVVRQFINGQTAQREQQRSEVLKSVGGEEKFQEMTAWAKANLDKADLIAYNKAVSSGDLDVVKLAVGALQAKYINANGQPPGKQMQGKAGNANSKAEPFESRQQYVDAIKNPLYDRDPAYRNLIMKRLEVSQIF
jgi:hypothetical protein